MLNVPHRFEGNAPCWYRANGWTLFVCPSGHPSTLLAPNHQTNHSVDKDGGVHPSVICTWPGCSFHEFVTLNGWAYAQPDAQKETP